MIDEQALALALEAKYPKSWFDCDSDFHLVSVVLRERISQADLRTIVRLPRLQSLYLYCDSFDDSHVKLIPLSVRKAGVSSSRLTAAGFVHLRSRIHLEELDLSFQSTEEAVDWSFLSGLSSLRELTVTTSTLSTTFFQTIRTHKRITTLTLEGLTVLPEESFMGFNQNEVLESVTFLNGPEFREMDLDGLERCVSLRVLSVLHCTNANLVFLDARYPLLRTLSIREPRFNASNLRSLEGFPTLRRLSLQESVISKSDLTSLCRAPQIRVVDVSRTEVTSADARSAIGNNNLVAVYVRDPADPNASLLVHHPMWNSESANME